MVVQLWSVRKCRRGIKERMVARLSHIHVTCFWVPVF